MLAEIIKKIKEAYREHVQEYYDTWDGYDDIFLEKIDAIIKEEEKEK